MFKKHYENDNYKLPKRYERMSKEKIEKHIRFYEFLIKLLPKRRKTKVQTDINFYF